MAHRISVSSGWINGNYINEDGEDQIIFVWVEEERKSNAAFTPANFEMPLGQSGEEGLNNLFKVMNISNNGMTIFH